MGGGYSNLFVFVRVCYHNIAVHDQNQNKLQLTDFGSLRQKVVLNKTGGFLQAQIRYKLENKKSLMYRFYMKDF